MSERPLRLISSRLSLTELAVSGFKSIKSELRLNISPLTILAGANSTGKSSAIQPLLLLKQTLEVYYDPGPLLLSGSHLSFSEASQLFYKSETRFEIEIELHGERRLRLYFEIKNKKKRRGLEIIQMDVKDNRVDLQLRPGMSREEIFQVMADNESTDEEVNRALDFPGSDRVEVRRNRCFLEIVPSAIYYSIGRFAFAEFLQSIIHLPGLRGNPERTYPVSNVGSVFPGTFEKYTASVIAQWETNKDARLNQLAQQLVNLGLTWKVEAKVLDDTKVELKVARTPKPQQGGARDMVNVADVGFGVSQTLPVLVALLVAKKGQLVYIEQPELHLHPRAQIAMAEVLASAARRGVRVVIETHSSLLLLGIQTLIAEQKLDADLVKLHWFKRNETGETTVTSGDIDRTGAFGAWPEDFGDVSLEAERRFLDASETRLLETSENEEE